MSSDSEAIKVAVSALTESQVGLLVEAAVKAYLKKNNSVIVKRGAIIVTDEGFPEYIAQEGIPVDEPY